MSKSTLLTLLMLIPFGMKGHTISTAAYNSLYSPEIMALNNESLCADSSGSSISGRLKYDNSQLTPIINSTVYLKTLSGVILDSTLTDLHGNYKFCGLQNGNYIISANIRIPTGGINTIDALLILKHYLGYPLLAGLKEKAADVNLSGYINSSDALKVQKRYVGLIPDFPGMTWVFEEQTVSISGPSAVAADLSLLCAGDVNGDYVPPATSQPCPGIPSLDYGGQLYTTVKVGTQCWMKENLNIGTMINDTGSQSDNGTIEKYCYDNVAANCPINGGLYQWDEMMQYTTTSGAQGICPSGWHIPTDEEWCTLTKSIDYTVNCDHSGWDGSTAGLTMKEADSGQWQSNTAPNNQSGFSALGAGYRNTHKVFRNIGQYALFWTASRNDALSPWYRSLYGYNDGIYRYTTFKTHGFSVRCLKD